MTHDPVTDAVTLLFRSPGVAIIAAGLLLLWAAALIVRTRFAEHRPLMEALDRRVDAVLSVMHRRERLGVDAEAEMEAVAAAFRTDHPALGVLAGGWERFRRGLFVGPSGRPAAAMAAADVFDPLDGSARTLDWWSNIVVAVGLTLTFLGLIAALSEATGAMNAGAGAGGTAAIQPALIGLLTVATTKFWTSVGGVVGSIALRYAARRRRAAVNEAQRQVIEALDHWAPPVNLEALTMEQTRAIGRLADAVAALPGARA